MNKIMVVVVFGLLKKMIIIKLTGGLGNQMFQYALGRSLSIRHKTKFKLDISNYKNDKLRSYSLSCFDIKTKIATRNELDKFIPYSSIQKILEKIKPSTFKRHIIYTNTDYNSNILKVKNALLYGYWQSPKYFERHGEIIKKDFTLKDEYDDHDHALLEKINQSESISLHVRRGDYVNNPKMHEYYYQCDQDYYNKAIKLIKNKHKNTALFVFSDDIDWAKSNLNLNENTTFIEGKKDYLDMFYMSKCKHNIIANSSFSWWGAWLNINPEKQIIAPKKWYKKTEQTTKDLIPNTWQQI